MSAKLPPADDKPVQFDDVLRRMLASPPAPHVKKKPAPSTGKKPKSGA